MKLNKVFSKLVLLPCSKVYGAITYVRNKLYDWNIIPQHEFGIPIISVGNLAVGGTGKTPHVEYIVDALRLNYHVAVLSRGYKRKTKGFVLATRFSKPEDIGDESYQIFQKFDFKVTVAVGEDRVNAIRELLRIDPQINLIVLDDAFQHRAVKPSLSILVTEYNRPFFDDKMMPYGRLRESRQGANRADIVIASKCPEVMKDLDYRLFSKNLNLFPCQQLFFSKFAYQELMPLYPELNRSLPYLDWMTDRDSILAVAGVGNPRPFVRYLKSFLPKVRVNVFSDHHDFTRADMELILKRFNTMKGKYKVIITTEKDAVRLVGNPHLPEELREHIFYLPIKVEFSTHNDSSFIDALNDHLRKFKHS